MCVYLRYKPAFEVTGAGGQQDVVRMPVQTEDGGTDGLLDVLADPPVFLLFKVADGVGMETFACRKNKSVVGWIQRNLHQNQTLMNSG